LDGFRKILVVHEGAHLERDLLECAAVLAALHPEPWLGVAAVPRNGIPTGLTAAARVIGEAHGVDDIAVRLVTECEQDAIFDAVRETGADLLVARHPGGLGYGPEIVRRFLLESPCPICLVPPASRIRLRRIAAAVDLGPSAHAVMTCATTLCARARVERLIAVHALAPASIPPSPDESHDEALLALYRCKAQVPPPNSHFTPIVTVGNPWDRAVLAAAAAHDADLVVTGCPSSLAPRRAWHRRAVEHLAADCVVPLLCVPTRTHHYRAHGRLRRVLSESEPAFN
jgi:nucleotide-binding universal stress UspA family protein